MIWKKVRDDVPRYNENLVRNTTQNNKSLKKTKQQLMIGKKQIIAGKRPDGIVTRNKRKLLKYLKIYTENSITLNKN